MRVLKWLDDSFEEALLVVLLVLISCVELAQVLIRNVPFIPALTWAEEFCRFCWIWSVFISLPYTIRKSSMLRVSVLADLLPRMIRRGANIAVDVITAACMLLLGWHSIIVVKSIMTSGETTPAMLWPMWIIYSVLLLGFFGGTIRALQQVYLHLRSYNDVEMTTAEKVLAEAAEEAEAVRQGKGGKV